VTHDDKIVDPTENAETSAPVLHRKKTRFGGLSVKLLVLTVLFVMVAEVFIYVPSIANFRNSWLLDRIAMARVAVVALSQKETVEEEFLAKVLKSAGARAIAQRSPSRSRMWTMEDALPEVDHHADVHQMIPVQAIIHSFGTLFGSGDGTIRVIGPVDIAGKTPGTIELIVNEGPLQTAMIRFSGNILGLSLIISLITAALVYLALRWLMVRPLQHLTQAMDVYSDDPEDASRIVAPSGRNDEIGDAESGLADMQGQLAQTLQQKQHLADLGLAVSKINHDLRNILASAQLFTDRIGSLPDPTVQRLAPKLVAALDRAIGYTSSVLSYGRSREAPPDRRLLNLHHIVGDVAEILGLPGSSITFENAVPNDLEIDADPDQLFRVLTNLCRNSAQALQAGTEPALVRRLAVGAHRSGAVVTIQVNDTGPGLPPVAKEHLFQAFHGSVSKGGTGLGLAIAAELVRAHGGTIQLLDDHPGAAFEITLPDRAIDFQSAKRAAIRDNRQGTGQQV